MSYPYLFPDVVRIESSGACNFKCRHCSQAQSKSGRGVMPLPLFDLLVSQLKKAPRSVRVAVLYHGGEPFLNKNLFYFIDTLKKMGASIKFNSNASLLTLVLQKEIIKHMDAMDHIVFSFDGNTIEENNYIRVNGDFESDSNNVISLLRLMEEGGCKARITVSNVRVCLEEELDLLYKEQGNVLKTPDYIKERFFMYPNVLYETNPAMRWPNYNMQESIYSLRKVDKERSGLCSAFDTITVLSNGDVVPCCYDINGAVVLGNIQQNSITSIWESATYREFRDRLSRRDLGELCKNCVLFSNEYLVQRGENW